MNNLAADLCETVKKTRAHHASRIFAAMPRILPHLTSAASKGNYSVFVKMRELREIDEIFGSLSEMLLGEAFDTALKDTGVVVEEITTDTVLFTWSPTNGINS